MVAGNNEEGTPLLGGNNTYYFKKNEKKNAAGNYESVSDGDGGQVVETLPSGSTEEDFAPRTLGTLVKVSGSMNELLVELRKIFCFLQ